MSPADANRMPFRIFKAAFEIVDCLYLQLYSKRSEYSANPTTLKMTSRIVDVYTRLLVSNLIFAVLLK